MIQNTSKLQQQSSFQTEVDEMREQLLKMEETETANRKLREDLEASTLAVEKFKFSNQKLKRKLNETSEELVTASTNLTIATNNNECLAAELRDARERAWAAEIQQNELAAQVATLQVKFSQLQSGLFHP